jgi:exo-beta-1,3-glucanase (GH17 family)
MNNNKLPYAKAICYSGYRDGQDPDGGGFPSYQQVKEDLLILKDEWKSLRLYGSDQHSVTILEVIDKECLPFDVMLVPILRQKLATIIVPGEAIILRKN